MLKYKLLALDVDDTLLNSKGELTRVNLDAINRAKEAGVCVAICTGRSYSGCAKVLDRIGLGESVVINYGGVQITRHPSGETRVLCALDHDSAMKAINFARDKGLHVQGYIGENLYYEQSNGWSDFYEGRVNVKGTVVRFDDMCFDNSAKVLIIAAKEDIDALFEQATLELGGEYNIVRSNERFLEFYSKEASKGVALAALAHELNIDKSEVIAMGDENIDSSMIQYAGLGVAVANARESVKLIADYISPSCDEDAVAHVINKFIFEEAIN